MRLAAASQRPAALCKLATAYIVSVIVVGRIIARWHDKRNEGFGMPRQLHPTT
jgi:hypothetical protein